MTQYLPPNLLALFAPREPIPYLPPTDKLPHEKKNVHNYLGVGEFIERAGFEDPKDTPPPLKLETREERLERKRKEKEEQVAYKLEQEIAMWDPNAPLFNAATKASAAEDGEEPEDVKGGGKGDPFKTLFVARINYYTSESKIRREFESFGPIQQIHMVHATESGKPRGYCFIEYEHERDMHSAYKKADGMKIDGRRVLVDVERARTVKGWLPRRLGGGLGGTRRGGQDVNVRHSGREGGSGRHRSRSKDRERDRRRSRSREKRRKRTRSRSRERSKRAKRSRSRERRRSRSRERSKRNKRSRSRSRETRRRERRARREAAAAGGGFNENGVRVKNEPGEGDGFGDYYGEGGGVQVKRERMDEEEEKPYMGGGDRYPDNY